MTLQDLGQRVIPESMSEDNHLPAQDLDAALSMMDRIKTKTSSNTSMITETRSPESSNPTSAPSTGRASTSTRNSIQEAPLTKEEIEKKPWKYIGYKGYSDFIASENDFYILRRFASLNARVALALQDQISLLEEQLDDLDKHCSRRDAEDLHNGTFRDDREERMALVEVIYEKSAKYNAFILQQTALKKYPAAPSPDVKSIRTWHDNHDGVAISSDEQNYLTHDLDLFCVVPKEKTPLRRLLDRSRRFRIHSLWKSKEARELPIYDQDLVTYTSDKRIERFVTLVIVGVGTVMLLAPMWILQAVHNDNYKLAVITAFVVVFLGLVSSATVAKPFETLAATAAYSAVLMVFLQLGTSSGG